MDGPTANDDEMESVSVPDRTLQVMGVLGRVLHAPRARPEEAARRIDLLTRMLSSGEGWWTAEDLAVAREEEPEVRDTLKELRRAGVLAWDERAGGYLLIDEMRVPLALMLLAVSPTNPNADQLRMLDALLPFAEVATRGDHRAAPVWAMIDVLQRDTRTLEDGLSSPDVHDALTQSSRSAEDMRELSDRLLEIEETSDPAMRTVVGRAVSLLAHTGDLVSKHAIRASRGARDQLRLGGSQWSAQELREAAGRLDDHALSLAIGASVGLVPTVDVVPTETELAAVLPPLLEDLDDALRNDFPSQEDLGVFDGVEVVEPTEDSRDLAQRRLGSARTTSSRALGRELFGEVPTWSDALQLQHGLVRVQAEAARNGVAAWRTGDQDVELRTRSVHRLTEIIVDDQETTQV